MCGELAENALLVVMFLGFLWFMARVIRSD